MNIGFSINRRIAAAMLLTMLAITAFAETWFSQSISPALADEPPVDAGCFNGALSDDPLHCYVLEAAQREGIIKIESIFQVGKVLHVYLYDTEPVSNEVLISDEVIEYFKAKSIEFVEQWPDRVFYGKYETCARRIRTSPLDCLLNHHTGWHETAVMPHAENYENVLLRPWTSESLRSNRGWAAYRQVWPNRATGGQGVPAIPSVFDVSEVDMTNIPELDCYARTMRRQSGGCSRNEQHPNVGNIVGWYTTYDRGWVQLKPPQDEDLDIEAAKEELIRTFPTSSEGRWFIIPVKYDYQELWRWATLIDRFAFTSGNSIGITSAFVASNVDMWANFAESVFPLPSLPEAEPDAWADHRTTIVVSTFHLQETLNTLPKLLDQLGIPVDAVGVVIRYDDTPEGPRKGWFSGGEPTRVSTGDPDVPSSGSGDIPPPPDTNSVETDSTPDTAPATTPHATEGPPLQSAVRTSNTPSSDPNGGANAEHSENASLPKGTTPTASQPQTAFIRTSPAEKPSQTNTTTNSVEEKNGAGNPPTAQPEARVTRPSSAPNSTGNPQPAQTAPTIIPERPTNHQVPSGLAAPNAISTIKKSGTAPAVLSDPKEPGTPDATDAGTNTMGDSKLLLSSVSALILVTLVIFGFLRIRRSRRRA